MQQTSPTHTDIDLIRRCQQGDRQAFNRLVMRYQNLVYNFLYRLAPHWNDVDDLAQDVFVKAYHSIDALNDCRQFKSWLHQIAVRVYVDAHRKRQKQQERFIADERLLARQADPNENPAKYLERQELQQRLQAAIDQLPEEFKLAIVLREIQDLTYEEIAETLNCSVGTVRSRMFRGRKLLRQILSAPEAVRS